MFYRCVGEVDDVIPDSCRGPGRNEVGGRDHGKVEASREHVRSYRLRKRYSDDASSIFHRTGRTGGHVVNAHFCHTEIDSKTAGKKVRFGKVSQDGERSEFIA